MHTDLPIEQGSRPIWDIFCQVIDNFGDIGVCWRLAADLAQRGQEIRLWVDDPGALDWMAPGANEGAFDDITVLPWQQASLASTVRLLAPSHVWIEAFGCEIPLEFVQMRSEWISEGQNASSAMPLPPPVWINLEYLSAEDYVGRSHGLLSPVMQGPGKGWSKYFFYPGFTPQTGGLIREQDLADRQAQFDHRAWLEKFGADPSGETIISLFSYEPDALISLMERWQQSHRPVHLLVTQGRSARWAAKCLTRLNEVNSSPESLDKVEKLVRVLNANQEGTHHFRINQLRVTWLPHLTQRDFDHLLWSSDFNFVRGEDSLVRAIWSGKPFVWQAYPQSDLAHGNKLQAFLQETGANKDLCDVHWVWNDLIQADALTVPSQDSESSLGKLELAQWRMWAQSLKARLQTHDDLASALLRFIHKAAKM